MKIAIYSQKYKPEYQNTLLEIFGQMTPQDIIFAEKNLWTDFSKKNKIDTEVNTFSSIKDLDKSFDLMLTIGGDGTILRAMTYIKHLEIPILGINAGRLGFLATISQGEVSEMLHKIRLKEYTLSPRTILEIQTKDGKPIGEEYFALNEVTIIRKNTTSMITIETHLNKEFLTSYWADGLIISTPTGSTGYSLSCGGPVVMPTSGNLVLTPIAPHNLSARPLIIPDHLEVSIKAFSRENSYFVSYDTHLKSLSCDTEIIIKKAPFSLNMIEIESNNFIKTLRNKLLWGEDKRN
ncbi:MAG: NAD kinase [Capnocytophaga sp.]|nr:NAD kinase [Capnocytophaga sp.]